MIEAQQAGYGDETGRTFLDEIRVRVRLPFNVTSEGSVEAVMCTLSQHVSWGGARRVFEALPRSLYAMCDRCPNHRTDPPLRLDRTELRQRVGEHLHVSPGDAEDLTSTVITTISARLGRGVNSLAGQLPRDLQSLWIARHVASPSEPHPAVSRIARRVVLPAGVDGESAFAIVMGLLSRRLSRREARHVVESFPRDLAILVEDYLDDREEQPVRFHADELLDLVAQELNTDDVDEAELVAREVFRATKDYLRAEVFEHVLRQLPADLRELLALP